MAVYIDELVFKRMEGPMLPGHKVRSQVISRPFVNGEIDRNFALKAGEAYKITYQFFTVKEDAYDASVGLYSPMVGAIVPMCETDDSLEMLVKIEDVVDVSVKQVIFSVPDGAGWLVTARWVLSPRL